MSKIHKQTRLWENNPIRFWVCPPIGQKKSELFYKRPRHEVNWWFVSQGLWWNCSWISWSSEWTLANWHSCSKAGRCARDIWCNRDAESLWGYSSRCSRSNYGTSRTWRFCQYGEKFAMFEAIHGSAPFIAGQNVANTSGLIQGAILMLNHIWQSEVAEKILNACLKTIEDGYHTFDRFKEKTSIQKLGTR